MITIEDLIKQHIDHTAFDVTGKPRCENYKRYKAIEQSLVTCNIILNRFGLRCDGKDFYTGYDTIQYWNNIKLELLKEKDLCK